MGYSFWIVLDQIVLDHNFQLNGLRAQEYEVCITRVARVERQGRQRRRHPSS